MASVYTVGQISLYIRNMFQQDYLLGKVSIRGEVSNCKYHNSGNLYFSLKDETAAMPCMMRRADVQKLSFRLRDGQSVVAAGTIGVYLQGGRYQMYVSQLQQDGLGALYERYEALRRELEEMGMFDPAYKKPIPKYIRTLGVVTAPDGAAVRDIIQISKRRNPGIQIILYPAKVQGEGAAASIVRGLRAVAAAGAETIIVGRGGGSIEDLWAFNEEMTARAVFECPVPVISAVGHETDTVITDFAADLRAPTPSAAAELAVADMAAQKSRLDEAGQRMTALMRANLRQNETMLRQYRLRLRAGSPAARVQDLSQTLDRWSDRLQRAITERISAERTRYALAQDRVQRGMRERLSDYRNRESLLQERMRGLSPYDKLDRGYALLTDEDGRRISLVSQTAPGSGLYVYLSDGRMKTRVESTEEGTADYGRKDTGTDAGDDH